MKRLFLNLCPLACSSLGVLGRQHGEYIPIWICLCFQQKNPCFKGFDGDIRYFPQSDSCGCQQSHYTVTSVVPMFLGSFQQKIVFFSGEDVFQILLTLEPQGFQMELAILITIHAEKLVQAVYHQVAAGRLEATLEKVLVVQQGFLGDEIYIVLMSKSKEFFEGFAIICHCSF